MGDNVNTIRSPNLPETASSLRAKRFLKCKSGTFPKLLELNTIFPSRILKRNPIELKLSLKNFRAPSRKSIDFSSTQRAQSRKSMDFSFLLKSPKKSSRNSIDFSSTFKSPKTQSRNSICQINGGNLSTNLEKPFNICEYFSILNQEFEDQDLSSTEMPSIMTAEEALKKFGRFLSVFEQKEIKRFKNIYYIKKNREELNSPLRNKEGDYLYEIGDSICYRYEILQLIAYGCFGQVLKCLDHKTKEEVAIKVLKKTHTSKKQGLTEYKIIQLLQSNAPNNNCIVEVRRKFEFRFHFFIVFELLGVDLHHFLHVHEYRPISVNLVKRIAAQLLTGLAQMHSLNIIHCDLKPENIAFKNSNKSSIRILDFGSSCFADMMIFTYIQTRLYRSPEVILQCGDYDSAIDIWSLGCIVAELLLGEPVFKGKNEARMIKSIVRVLGFPPENVVNRAKAKSLLKNCYERGVVSLRSVFTKYSQDVVDFIEGCLKWEPDKRITAQEGLNAKWFRPMHSRVKSMIY